MENAHKNVSVTGHTLSICVKPGSTDIGSRGMRVTRDITRRCWEAIQNHLAASGREITNDSPPFTLASAGEYHGKNGNVHYPITTEVIRPMHAFGDEIKVRPHTLHHSAVTLLRKRGCSVEDAQSFLKHRRLDTTRRFLHVVEADDPEFGECIARMLDL